MPRRRHKRAPVRAPKTKRRTAMWPDAVKRRCVVCRRSVYYCGAPVDVLPLRNPNAPEQVLNVPRGEPVCRACLRFNAAEMKVRDLPVATDRKKCHRCGGAGSIPDPASPGRWASGVQPRRAGELGRDGKGRRSCPRCAGTGKVACDAPRETETR